MSAVALGKKAAVPATAERKPKGRGHERREEILAAAARMFLEKGVERVSTRAIAEAVGISQTSLYVYFPNRNAILEELCDQCFLRLIERFSSPEVQSGTPPESLRKMMRAYVEFGIDHSDEYRIGFMMKETHQHPSRHEVAALLDGSMPRETAPPGMRCFLMLQDRVTEIAAMGLLRGDPRLIAQVIWATGHGLVTLLITMDDFPWFERGALIDGAIDVQFHGMLVAPSRVTNR
jgi:AcrR family transcriptional regulator